MAEKQEREESNAGVYDLGYHILGSISETDLPKEVEKLKNYLEKQGASVVGEKAPTLHSLAYTISRMVKGKREDYDTAYFGTIIFEAVSMDIPAIEALLRADVSLLRFLLIKTDSKGVEEALKQEKGEKDEVAGVSEEQLNKTIEALTI